MDNYSGEENDDNVMKILQSVQVRMENVDDDNDEDDYKVDPSIMCKVVVGGDDDDDDDDEEGEEEEESEGEVEDSQHDPTNTSTHQLFEQVFIKEEVDSNLISMDEECYSESGEDAAGGISDPLKIEDDPPALLTEGLKIEESLDEYKRRVYNCVACNARYLRRDSLIKHLTVDHKGLVYFCSICHQIFSSSLNLQLHIKTHVKTRLGCHVCGLVLASKKTLENHLIIHGIHLAKKERAKHFVCNVCNEFFNELNALTRHMLTHKSIMFSCKACKFWCDSEVVFQNHLDKHNGDNQVYTCYKCDKSFPTQNDLNFHEKSFNCSKSSREAKESEMPHRCAVCGKRLQTISLLNEHMIEHGSKMYSCGLCGKVYNYNAAFVKHIQQHNVDPECVDRYRKELNVKDTTKRNDPDKADVNLLSCGICGKNYQYQAALSNHMLLIHDKSPPMSELSPKKLETRMPPDSLVQCPNCGKCYQYQASLVTHMRECRSKIDFANANQKLDSPCELDARGKKKRPYKCELCSKRFPSNRGLLKHISTHTAQTYPCKVCGKVFYYSTSFYKHLRNHNMGPNDIHKSRRELPSVEDIVECNSDTLKCDICSIKFKSKEELLTHRRSHRAKNFRCKICGKCYRNQASLKTHIRECKTK